MLHLSVLFIYIRTEIRIDDDINKRKIGYFRGIGQ